MKRETGFTMIELVVVLGMIGIVTAISLPNMIDWWRDTAYRDASRQILYLSRQTRDLAISRNQEYRIKIDPAARTLTTQNRPASTFVDFSSETLAPAITLKTNADCNGNGTVYFSFNPNGSSGTAYVCVVTPEGVPRFRVGLPQATTGRTVIERCDPSKAPQCL